MTPEEIYQQALETQRQRDAAEAQYQAYRAKTQPYEDYQGIIRLFEKNASCRPVDTCRNNSSEIAAYHAEMKQFAIFQHLEFETAKLQGWKAINNGLNFGVRSHHEPYLYSLKNEDIPSYPYAK